jgi:hypothetical protein
MISPSVIEKFRASLRGSSCCVGDSGYDQARKVWNGAIDKHPAVIARCAGVSDVIHCVNFARANDLLLAVRGGGHNISGNAVCDEGLVIDLSRMKGLRVDPVHRTARAEPGLTWGECDRETQAFGLATTGGQISNQFVPPQPKHQAEPGSIDSKERLRPAGCLKLPSALVHKSALVREFKTSSARADQPPCFLQEPVTSPSDQNPSLNVKY